MLGRILALIFLYFAIGFMFMGFYAIRHNLDMIFSHCNTDEENNMMILVWTFWPVHFIIIIVKALVYYFKHLYVAIRDMSKKYIKIQ